MTIILMTLTVIAAGSKTIVPLPRRYRELEMVGTIFVTINISLQKKNSAIKVLHYSCFHVHLTNF